MEKLKDATHSLSWILDWSRSRSCFETFEMYL